MAREGRHARQRVADGLGGTAVLPPGTSHAPGLSICVQESPTLLLSSWLLHTSSLAHADLLNLFC